MNRSLDGWTRSQAARRIEFRYQHPNGQTRWMLGVSSPRPEPDGTVVWHGYLEDITEYRELEKAREAAAAAEAANRAKTEFLSRMSHELRTPLNAVLGFAQLMELDETEPLGPAQRHRLTLVRESGEHLLRMIGDLLDHSRIEAGQLAVDLVDVPVLPLLRECADMLAPGGAGGRRERALGRHRRGAAGARRQHAPEAGAAQPAEQRHQVQPPAAARCGWRRRPWATQVCLRVIDNGVGIAPADLGKPVRALQPPGPAAQRRRGHRHRPGHHARAW